jgi:hypothetical protein
MGLFLFVIMKAGRLNTPAGIYTRVPATSAPRTLAPAWHSRTVINHPPGRSCPFNSGKFLAFAYYRQDVTSTRPGEADGDIMAPVASEN